MARLDVRGGQQDIIGNHVFVCYGEQCGWILWRTVWLDVLSKSVVGNYWVECGWMLGGQSNWTL